MKISINDRVISENEKPYVIAEISANHSGNIATAFKLIKSARDAGADAVKLQTYTAESLTLKSNKPDFQITDGLWKGNTLYSLYENASMPWDWHGPLFECAREHGITIFSSPFDRDAVELLHELDCPAYKIASFELQDTKLIEFAAGTGKPLIMSCGMADVIDIERALEAADKGGAAEVALLHCISGYPAAFEDCNVSTIVDMKNRFNRVVGLSDHSLGMEAALCSVSLGGAIVEKHFTLDRRGGSPDDSFSIEPDELKLLCNNTESIWRAKESVQYIRSDSESKSLQFRRSLYFCADLPAGHTIRESDIKSVRRGFGLPPYEFDSVVGTSITRHVAFGDPGIKEVLEKQGSKL